MDKYKIVIDGDAVLREFCASKTPDECKSCILYRSDCSDSCSLSEPLCMSNYDKKQALKILEINGIIEKVTPGTKKYTFKTTSLPLKGTMTVEVNTKIPENIEMLLVDYCMLTNCNVCPLGSWFTSKSCALRDDEEKLKLLIMFGAVKEEEIDE